MLWRENHVLREGRNYAIECLFMSGKKSMRTSRASRVSVKSCGETGRGTRRRREGPKAGGHETIWPNRTLRRKILPINSVMSFRAYHNRKDETVLYCPERSAIAFRAGRRPRRCAAHGR